MKRGWRMAILGPILLVLISLPLPAQARDVQTLRTPGGIGLWLVEEPGLPLVALRFAMRGGSLADPPDKEGAGDLFAALLDQGAGPLDAEAFQGRLEALGSRLSFSISRFALSGGFVSVSRNLAATADLLRLSVTEPRCLPADFERVRRQKIASAMQDESHPDRLALRLFYANAFAGHAYARPVRGTAETLARLTVADMAGQRATLLRGGGLHVVIVGAVSARDAAAFVDGIFASLPEGNAPTAIASVEPAPVSAVLPAPEGQALETAVFALPMPRTGDASYSAALALAHILGSGNFDARLTQDVRVKRALTYAISAHLLTDPAASFLLGTFSTEPGRMDEALGTLRETLATLQRDGPGERELANAKSSLNGSHLLGADGSAGFADYLLGLWVDGLGPSYDEVRKSEINAVSLDGARQAARALFDPRAMRQLILRPAGRD
jgi:zinc protease